MIGAAAPVLPRRRGRGLLTRSPGTTERAGGRGHVRRASAASRFGLPRGRNETLNVVAWDLQSSWWECRCLEPHPDAASRERAKGEIRLRKEQSVVRLPGSYLREIVEHAREGSPNEVCGLIAGRGGYPVKLYRTTNDDPNPRVRYNVEPRELLEIHREIEENGWSLMAIYHSHPASEAYPSETDVRLSYYPDAVYLICSLADEDPVVRAFRIVDRQVTELALEVEVETEGQRHAS